MPKIIKPLSQTQIANAKIQAKDYKLSDGNGLCLLVKHIGTKMWRYDFTFEGKRNSLSLGLYPIVSLKEAREKRDAMRKLIDQGINPSAERKKIKSKHLSPDNTFEAITHEFLSLSSNSPAYILKQQRMIEKDILPFIKNRDINELTSLEFLEILKKIESRGAVETAHRALALCNSIYRYAVTVGKAKHNITADLDGRIALKAAKSKNYKHTTNIEELKHILRTIETYNGSYATKIALKLSPYVFVRSFNVRYAEWTEFDFEKKLWIIPAHKMKMKREHIVPLTNSVISIIKEMEPLSKHKSIYLFPSTISNHKTLSENTLNNALARLGLDNLTVIHGFRHTASTILHENIHIHKISSDVIEMQLAHSTNDVKSVYNKALYIPERMKLMQWYSDFLDQLAFS